MRPAILVMVTGSKFQASTQERRPTACQCQAQPDAALDGLVSAASAAEGFEDGSGVSVIDSGSGVYYV